MVSQRRGVLSPLKYFWIAVSLVVAIRDAWVGADGYEDVGALANHGTKVISLDSPRNSAWAT